MTNVDNLLIRLRGAGEVEAVNEIERLRKIVDALTVKLNAALTESYGLDDRITRLEQQVRMWGRRVL